MSKSISLIAHLSVRDGRLNDARELMNEMVAATRQETGTQKYELFISEDGKTVHANEQFADSDAVMVHLGKFGSKFGDRFLSCFEPRSLSVYGEPSGEARAAFDDLGAAYLESFGGFTR